MRRIILICDECKREEEQSDVINWLLVDAPDHTQFTISGGAPLPYGLFCSLKCLEERIERIKNPQPIQVGGWYAVEDDQ